MTFPSYDIFVSFVYFLMEKTPFFPYQSETSFYSNALIVYVKCISFPIRILVE